MHPITPLKPPFTSLKIKRLGHPYMIKFSGLLKTDRRKEEILENFRDAMVKIMKLNIQYINLE